jgi:hypothetical protein
MLGLTDISYLSANKRTYMTFSDGYTTVTFALYSPDQNTTVDFLKNILTYTPCTTKFVRINCELKELTIKFTNNEMTIVGEIPRNKLGSVRMALDDLIEDMNN